MGLTERRKEETGRQRRDCLEPQPGQGRCKVPVSHEPSGKVKINRKG